MLSSRKRDDVMRLLSISVVLVMIFQALQANLVTLPPFNFVYLTDIDTTLIESPRYRTMDNFTGRPVPGYESLRMILTLEAAEALKKAHDDFKKEGYMLVVYEAYRPQRAMNALIEWSKDIHDDVAREKYYPKIDKGELFRLGYMADKSPYSRGSTVSVTLIRADMPLKTAEVMEHRLTNGERIPYLDDNTVDMGSSFDLLHYASNHDSSLIGSMQMEKRHFLRKTMEKHGFVSNPKEWWSYTLKKEPYPQHYFDFVELDRRPLDVDFAKIKEEVNRPLRPAHILPVWMKLDRPAPPPKKQGSKR